MVYFRSAGAAPGAYSLDAPYPFPGQNYGHFPLPTWRGNDEIAEHRCILVVIHLPRPDFMLLRMLRNRKGIKSWHSIGKTSCSVKKWQQK